MPFNIQRNLTRLTLTGILLITLIASSNLNWGKQNWHGIIESDAKGYYSYLPAIFIYHDLNFGFFDSIEKGKYFDKNYYYDYRVGSNGNIINKYYCGTAFAEMPFFMIAHAIAGTLNFDADGYSKPYAVMVNVAALFYLLAGLFFLNRTLNLFNINKLNKSITLVAAVFATNLFYYAVVEPGMSHIYSFAFITMFLHYAFRYFKTLQLKYLILVSLTLGIIVLIRPVNGLIVFALPFAALRWDAFKAGLVNLLKHKGSFVKATVLFLVVISTQLIIYKISTGKFWVYAYGEEGFNFLSPHIFDILFSYRKGLFVYTPLLFIALSGGYFLYRLSAFAFYSWFGYMLLITYVLSSWWMWYYGGSFSGRVYVEYIPLFMILLSLVLQGIQAKIMKYSFYLLVFLLLVVCQIQTYQYRYNQIHWSEMTKAKYWDVFLRIDKL